MRGIFLPADFDSWISPLNDEERGRLLTAILAYSNHGQVEQMHGAEKYIFPILKAHLDEQQTKKEEISKMRSAAGKKGGRPPSARKQDKAIALKKKQKKQLLFDEKGMEDAKDGCRGSEKEVEPVSPPRFQIPLINGDFFEVTDDFMQHQSKLFPGVDVESEIRKMVGWCESQPTRRKTPSGIRRFINSWLCKAQDRAGTSSQQVISPVGRKPYKNELVDYVMLHEREGFADEQN